MKSRTSITYTRHISNRIADREILYMILGNTTKAFYCNSCLEKIFLGVSESFL